MTRVSSFADDANDCTVWKTIHLLPDRFGKQTRERRVFVRNIGTTRALRDAEHCLDKFFAALGWFRDCWHRRANIRRYFSVAKSIRSPYVLRLEARVLESDGLSYKQ